MKKRVLGRRTDGEGRAGQGLEVSAIGLGCMAMSGGFYGARDEARSRAALDRAIELGVDFFDTSDMYGAGHNEEFLGAFLRDRRPARAVIATKFGIRQKPGDYAREIDNSPAYVRQACEGSLRRLGVERIDLYYVHRIEPGRPIEEVMGVLADLVKEGKVAHVGLSEASAETLRRAHAVHPVTAVQTEYSLMTRDVEAEALPACRALGIGLVPYSPLGRGFLTGAVGAGDIAHGQDFRAMLPRFQEDALAANRALLDAVRALAARKGCSLAQIALAWVLGAGADVAPIPGTTRPERVAENVGALDVVLSTEERAGLSAAADRIAIVGARYTEEGFKGVQT